MGWEVYVLVGAGCLGTISLVMGLIDSLVWKRWEREQHAAYVAGLEDDYRDALKRVRSLEAQITEHGHQREQAYCQGWDRGEAAGHRDGYDHGFSDGYDMGYAAGRDSEHKYWTERGADECDPFGMARPTGVYAEPDNADPSVVAAINSALPEAPEGWFGGQTSEGGE